MAAMFQAQSQNWEEAQEKMSQLVSPVMGFIVCVVVPCLMNICLFFLRLYTYSSQRVYSNTRGTGFNRGGKPYQPHHDKPLPPSYVCYRCGQKGSHC